ncbi:hypothetical protein [Prevotella sp. E2-28]|uniref:hypothetical protein n=1 Tax=Prevotella sp. E2-28 TaxID=2913620 RepID=UPI001EDA399B|nr:hypothetical protein [Prevotella sp. E2-28]UKK53224.1 hypothetical protein L6465_11620 [Prevotella sp. E2-28]
MKRIYILIVALVGCMLTVTAQDVTILHMKDGTQRRYINGLKNATTVDFYEVTPSGQDVGSGTDGAVTSHDNGYTQKWDVTHVWYDGGQYSVVIVWSNDMPKNFQARHGICFGTELGLTTDHCDTLLYFTDTEVRFQGDYSPKRDGHFEGGNFWNVWASSLNLNYVYVGPKANSYYKTAYLQNNQYRGDFTFRPSQFNEIRLSLQYGQTYYYRTFAEGQVEENGQLKNKIFYGEEKSFRVPLVMADAAYYPDPEDAGSEEAIAAFASHFPDSVNAPTWKQMSSLWKIWRKTDEGKAFDLMAHVTSKKFDDGTGYRLNYIPDAFYNWMVSREILIDPFDVAEISRVYDTTLRDTIETIEPERITDVDAKWGVPGGKYIRFMPSVSTMNHSVNYRHSEVVPGVRYKLQINFAPETDEYATFSVLLPTKVDITDVKANKLIVTKQEIPATKVTTLEFDDFSTTNMGLDLRIDTRVTNVERRRETHNRIMRIAEIRLIPVK